jgi:hypothetical protein
MIALSYMQIRRRSADPSLFIDTAACQIIYKLTIG